MICDRCGFPISLCVCDEIDKEESILIVRQESTKWGKFRSVIENAPNPKELSRKLKKYFHTGGTAKNGIVIINSIAKYHVIEYLRELGYTVEKI